MRAPAAGHARQGFGLNGSSVLVGTPLNPNFAPIRGVPGPGFDFSHLAATRQQRPRHTRVSAPVFGEVFPIFPWYYGYDSDYYTEPQPQPEPAFAQPPQSFFPPQPPENPYGGQTPAAEPRPEALAANPQPEANSQPDLGRLVLVERDGQVILAVGFTVSGDRLTYITPEGLRRSIALADLDTEATREMNDANGTTLVFPGSAPGPSSN